MKKTKITRITKTNQYFSIQFGEPTWIEKFNDESIKIAGVSREICFYHYQDCCEDVYADLKGFESAYLNTSQFDRITFCDGEFSLEVSFQLKGKQVYRQQLNCYDIQNGYYNSDLSIIVFNPKTQENEEFDISYNNIEHDYN